MTDSRAQRILSTMQTQGWADVMSLLDEMAQDPKDELWEIMAKKPDSLTGKTALKYAIRSKALNDFKDELDALVRPLISQETEPK